MTSQSLPLALCWQLTRSPTAHRNAIGIGVYFSLVMPSTGFAAKAALSESVGGNLER